MSPGSLRYSDHLLSRNILKMSNSRRNQSLCIGICYCHHMYLEELTGQ